MRPGEFDCEPFGDDKNFKVLHFISRYCLLYTFRLQGVSVDYRVLNWHNQTLSRNQIVWWIWLTAQHLLALGHEVCSYCRTDIFGNTELCAVRNETISQDGELFDNKPNLWKDFFEMTRNDFCFLDRCRKNGLLLFRNNSCPDCDLLLPTVMRPNIFFQEDITNSIRIEMVLVDVVPPEKAFVYWNKNFFSVTIVVEQTRWFSGIQHWLQFLLEFSQWNSVAVLVKDASKTRR